VAAGAEDPVPVVLHGAVEGECGDRDEGNQERSRSSTTPGTSPACNRRDPRRSVPVRPRVTAAQRKPGAGASRLPTPS
jgi:hypothetical protein